MRYRTKPKVIEAFRFGMDPMPSWFRAAMDAEVVAAGLDFCRIHTLQGVQDIQPGDWVILGIRGEIHGCGDEAFRATYEPMNDDGQAR